MENAQTEYEYNYFMGKCYALQGANEDAAQMFKAAALASNDETMQVLYKITEKYERIVNAADEEDYKDELQLSISRNHYIKRNHDKALKEIYSLHEIKEKELLKDD